MNGTSDTGTAGTCEPEDGLDPRQAAQLLQQTEREARRELSFHSPRLSLLAAAVALAAFGAIWLSVRGQHPYQGPTPAGLAVLYALVGGRRANGVLGHPPPHGGGTGRAAPRRRGGGGPLAAALLAVYVVMAALAVDGASDGVVYGLYVPTATMLVLGVFWAARSAAREDRPELGMAIAIITVAAGSAFAGPRGVWLSNGVGLCVVLLANSALQVRLLHGSRAGA